MVARAPFRRKDDGSLTLEATLVVPFVMTAAFMMTVGVLSVFHEAILLAEARIAAERLADTWDESSKDVATGAFVPYERDPLYWRLFDDGLEFAFPFAKNPGRSAEVRLDGTGADTENIGGGLPARKLLRQAVRFPAQTGASFRYDRGWTSRVVAVRLEPKHSLSRLLSAVAPPLAAESSAPVFEPTEWIRTIDLARTYWPAVAKALNTRALESLFLTLKGNDGPPLFATELQARRALQRSVKGKEQWFFVGSPNSSRRLVDALDRHGVAHQAFLGYRTLNASTRDQLKKDAELLKTGRVKGVIWHFYRKEKTGRIGPSASLARELEKHGIAVVLHG